MGEILSVLHSPQRTFEAIRERGGAFLIPFIVVLAVTLVAIVLQLPVLEKTMDNAMEQVSDMESVDTDMAKKIGMIMALVMAPVSAAAKIFVVALLLLLVNLIVRGEAKYMQLVKVSILSGIPALINVLLTGILARTTDANSVNELSISLGAFMPEKEGFLFGLANLVNPFGIWGLAIMVIGTAVMTRRSYASVGVWIVAGYLLLNIPFAFFA